MKRNVMLLGLAVVAFAAAYAVTKPVNTPPGHGSARAPARPFTPQWVQKGGSFLSNDGYWFRAHPRRQSS